MPKGASSATARQRPGAVTFARLTPYLRGIIYGLRMADYGVQDIVKEVEKQMERRLKVTTIGHRQVAT